MREYESDIRQVLSYMPYAEIMYVSAADRSKIEPKLYRYDRYGYRESDTSDRNRSFKRDYDRSSGNAADLRQIKEKD